MTKKNKSNNSSESNAPAPPPAADIKMKPPMKKTETGVELKKANTGVPDVDSLGFIKFLPAFVLAPTISSAMGGFGAWLIYKNGKTELYDRNIAKLAESEQGYTLLAAVLFNLIVAWVNSYPMLYKTMVMRFSSGNLRANMQIYKASGAAADAGYTLLETHGAIGSYNRANRSLTHLVENSIPVALFIVLAGGVFPLPALALTALFGVGRALHQIGYATIGYGAHGPGFMLAEVARYTLQMLCVLAADLSLELGWFATARNGYARPALDALAPHIAPALAALEVHAPTLAGLVASI